MHIIWDKLSPEDWYRIYNRIPKTNLVQSYSYARAVRQIHQQVTRFGVIRAKDNSVIGLVQMQEIKIFGLIHRVFIDRGPLWCDPATTLETEKTFWTLIAESFPARLGRKRRFIPEAKADPRLPPIFEKLGYKKTGAGYKTMWLDLRADLDTLRAGLKPKWRNMLRRAEENSLIIDTDDRGIMLELLLAGYTQDKAVKKYSGASPQFIRALEMTRNPEEYSLILTAAPVEAPPVAMVYFRIHGTSATYQIGWSNDQGREKRAHHLLLWAAIKTLKDSGIHWLDLGGIDPDQAEGVTRFKKGLGGEMLETTGIYS